jgi:TPP-dependent pyruvate/acetoin dehydrogenase alpha subunit
MASTTLTNARTKKPSQPNRPERTSTGTHGLSPDQLRKLYYYMRLTREYEDTIYQLFQQGKIVGGAYSGFGNEATAVGSAFALDEHDYIFPLHRDMGAHVARGQTMDCLFLQYLGRGEGNARGRDGSGHYIDRNLRIIGNISHLGAMIPVACGVALAGKIRKHNYIVMTYIGDGGVNVGEVHEALAMASVMKLPVILIIENNQFAYSTPLSKQHAVERLSDRASGYGIPGVTVDGTDVLEVYRVCRDAVERGRNGGGPTIIESVTMRMAGHAAHDNAWYVPKELLQEWKKKDPIERYEKYLTDQRVLTEAQRNSMMGEIQTIVSKAAARALEKPYPPGEDAAKGVFYGE